MRPVIRRIVQGANGLFTYVFTPVACLIMTALPAFWWSSSFRGGSAHKLYLATMMLLMLAAMAYEMGYKKMYRYGWKKYFYFVHALPLLIGFLGFVYGLFRVYL